MVPFHPIYRPLESRNASHPGASAPAPRHPFGEDRVTVDFLRYQKMDALEEMLSGWARMLAPRPQLHPAG